MKILIQILIPRANGAGVPQEPNRAMQRAIRFEDRPLPGTEIGLEDDLTVTIGRYYESGIGPLSRRPPPIALCHSDYSIAALKASAPHEWDSVVLPKRPPIPSDPEHRE